MKWLLEAGKEKEKPVHLPFKFAHELIDAAENRVRNRKNNKIKNYSNTLLITFKNKLSGSCSNEETGLVQTVRGEPCLCAL